MECGDPLLEFHPSPILQFRFYGIFSGRKNSAPCFCTVSDRHSFFGIFAIPYSARTFIIIIIVVPRRTPQLLLGACVLVCVNRPTPRSSASGISSLSNNSAACEEEKSSTAEQQKCVNCVCVRAGSLPSPGISFCALSVVRPGFRFDGTYFRIPLTKQPEGHCSSLRRRA